MHSLMQGNDPNTDSFLPLTKLILFPYFPYLLLANTIIQRPPSKQLKVLWRHGLINPPHLSVMSTSSRPASAGRARQPRLGTSVNSPWMPYGKWHWLLKPAPPCRSCEHNLSRADVHQPMGPEAISRLLCAESAVIILQNTLLLLCQLQTSLWMGGACYRDFQPVKFIFLNGSFFRP